MDDLYFWGIKKGELDFRKNYSCQTHLNGLEDQLKEQVQKVCYLESVIQERNREFSEFFLNISRFNRIMRIVKKPFRWMMTPFRQRHS
jgi:hypothetical protein